MNQSFKQGGNDPEFATETNKFDKPREAREAREVKESYECDDELRINRNNINNINNIEESNETALRLSKAISVLGLASRRQGEELIKQGKIMVNGVVVKSIFTKIAPSDKVQIMGDGEKPYYNSVSEKSVKKARNIIFYKPKEVITSANDERGRKIIYDILPKRFKSLKYIGRLDFNSEGLLILTDSNLLKQFYESPKNEVKRKYKVKIYGREPLPKLKSLSNGFKFKDDKTGKIIHYKPFKVYPASENKRKVREYRASKTSKMDAKNFKEKLNNWFYFELSEGKNREIRNICQKADLVVNRLIRVQYGQFSLGRLQPGEFLEKL